MCLREAVNELIRDGLRAKAPRSGISRANACPRAPDRRAQRRRGPGDPRGPTARGNLVGDAAIAACPSSMGSRCARPTPTSRTRRGPLARSLDALSRVPTLATDFGRRRDRGQRARGYDHRLLPGEGAGAERRGGARRDRQPRVGLRVRRAQPAERLRHPRAPCQHRPGRDGVASRTRQEPPRGDRDRRRLPRARVARPGPDRGGRPAAPGCAALAAAATGLCGALARRGGGSPRRGAHRGRDTGGHAHRRGRRRRALSPGAGPHPGRRAAGPRVRHGRAIGLRRDGGRATCRPLRQSARRTVTARRRGRGRRRRSRAVPPPA